MKNHRNAYRAVEWVGIVAPVLFVAIFSMEGNIRPGYDPRSMYISALSLGPRGWIQMANFLLLGTLLGVFTWVMALGFWSEKPSRLGVILLGILSVLFFISGPFVMDPAGTSLEDSTVHGIIHGLAGGIVFLLMPVTIFAFLRLIRKDPQLHAIYGWSLVIGIVEAAAVLGFTIISKAPSLLDEFAGWMGLIQRSALVPFMVWLFIFALSLSARDKTRRS